MMTATPATARLVKGSLHLQFSAQEPARTVLNVIEQTGPLKIVRAFPLESGAALAHLHNVSGGILGGDSLDYAFDLDAGTEAQITTTSATRVYRRREGVAPAVQRTTINVGPDALAELIPDPVIPFARSAYRQETRVALSEGAGLFWWETIAPGRTVRGELFEYDSLELHTEMCAGDRPIAIERARIEPALRPLLSAVRLGKYRYFSTFYMCKVGVDPAQWTALESQLRDLAGELSRRGEVAWGVSALVAHGLVARGLSLNSRDLAPGLLALWQAAKQALYGRTATMPRKVY